MYADLVFFLRPRLPPMILWLNIHRIRRNNFWKLEYPNHSWLRTNLYFWTFKAPAVLPGYKTDDCSTSQQILCRYFHWIPGVVAIYL